MMLRWILLLAGVALTAACDASTTSEVSPRKRPEHPDAGTPEDRPPTTPPPAPPPDLPKDIFVYAGEDGRTGCGKLRMSEIVEAPSSDSGHFTFQATARWASFPPNSLNGNQVTMDVAYRSGDFPISSFTDEYPDDGTVGLKYLVTGVYDPSRNVLRVMLRNMDTENSTPSNVFLTPVYESWNNPSGTMTDCIASPDFENEFFIAIPPREVEIPLTNPSTSANLCNPCPQPVENVSIEMR